MKQLIAQKNQEEVIDDEQDVKHVLGLITKKQKELGLLPASEDKSQPTASKFRLKTSFLADLVQPPKLAAQSSASRESVFTKFKMQDKKKEDFLSDHFSRLNSKIQHRQSITNRLDSLPIPQKEAIASSPTLQLVQQAHTHIETATQMMEQQANEKKKYLSNNEYRDLREHEAYSHSSFDIWCLSTNGVVPVFRVEHPSAKILKEREQKINAAIIKRKKEMQERSLLVSLKQQFMKSAFLRKTSTPSSSNDSQKLEPVQQRPVTN